MEQVNEKPLPKVVTEQFLQEIGKKVIPGVSSIMYRGRVYKKIYKKPAYRLMDETGCYPA